MPVSASDHEWLPPVFKITFKVPNMIHKACNDLLKWLNEWLQSYSVCLYFYILHVFLKPVSPLLGVVWAFPVFTVMNRITKGIFFDFLLDCFHGIFLFLKWCYQVRLVLKFLLYTADSPEESDQWRVSSTGVPRAPPRGVSRRLPWVQ